MAKIPSDYSGGNPSNAGVLLLISVVLVLLAAVVIVIALLEAGLIDSNDTSQDSAENVVLPSSSTGSSANRDSGGVSATAAPEGENLGNGDGAEHAAASDSKLTNLGMVADLSANASIFETESVRATLPADLAKKGYRWVSSSNERVELIDENGIVLAGVVWAGATSRGEETKSDSYEIGAVSHGSIGFPAILRLYYVNAIGKHIYWGADDEGELAINRIGVKPEDIASWIELYSVNGFYPVNSLDAKGSSNDTDNDFKTPLKEPFYGVWVAASKDFGEARSIANELAGAGFVGYVFMTTDWANLNSELWYVITAGYSKTEAEAQSLCDSVRNAGYSDANVKYSGDYTGSD